MSSPRSRKSRRAPARKNCGSGPNEHYFVYASNFWPRDPYFDWFGHWLKDEPSALVDEPAVYYSPRAWVDDRAATPRPTGVTPNAGRRRVSRRAGSICAATAASATTPSGDARRYRYDPRHPIPSLGGRNMLIDAGPRDQRPAQALPDYGLIYRGAPLDADLTIAGNVRVTLNVASDCPDTDFVAKLIETLPDGRAMLLMDGVMRAMYRDPGAGAQPLGPGRVYPLTIDLGDIHHTFRAGSRIEVDVTSSNFPRRARNTNSGNPVLANDGEADIRVAPNTVHHAPATPSFIELPVLRAKGSR